MVVATALATGQRRPHQVEIAAGALQRHQALAQIRQQVALPAELLQYRLERALARSPQVGAGEDALGNRVDLAAGVFEDIGEPVDDGFQQGEQDPGRTVQIQVDLRGPLRKRCECTRFGGTHGNQQPVGDHETDRRHLGILLLAARRQRDGQEIGAAFFVQTAGDLDLLHLVAGGNVDVQQLLEALDLGR